MVKSPNAPGSDRRPVGTGMDGAMGAGTKLGPPKLAPGGRSDMSRSPQGGADAAPLLSTRSPVRSRQARRNNSMNIPRRPVELRTRRRPIRAKGQLAPTKWMTRGRPTSAATLTATQRLSGTRRNCRITVAEPESGLLRRAETRPPSLRIRRLGVRIPPSAPTEAQVTQRWPGLSSCRH